MSDHSTIRKIVGEVEHTILDIDGRVLRITLNRSHVLNALYPPAHFELHRIFDAFADDPELWIAVITGAGSRSFCSGTDLKERARLGRDEYPSSGFAGLTHRFDLGKSVVAAINGLAVGGGLETALAADIVIAVEHAECGFPEPRVGLAAMSGGVQRLMRQISHKQAMGLLLTGRHISARQALDFGFVNQVVPGDQLQSTVHEWLADMLACAPLALRATKQVARSSLDHSSLAEALHDSYPAKSMLASEDAVEGPRAFAGKRLPGWRGC